VVGTVGTETAPPLVEEADPPVCVATVVDVGSDVEVAVGRVEDVDVGAGDVEVGVGVGVAGAVVVRGAGCWAVCDAGTPPVVLVVLAVVGSGRTTR
jgi:hypothetical protein